MKTQASGINSICYIAAARNFIILISGGEHKYIFRHPLINFLYLLQTFFQFRGGNVPCVPPPRRRILMYIEQIEYIEHGIEMKDGCVAYDQFEHAGVERRRVAANPCAAVRVRVTCQRTQQRPPCRSHGCPHSSKASPTAPTYSVRKVYLMVVLLEDYNLYGSTKALPSKALVLPYKL